MNIRTRFAPSPTGFLHVGGVRTALFAWLIAKQGKGKFILRIEDTDQSREVPGSVEHIIESLKWLGIEWDEGPDKEASLGPYKQSKRLEIYKEWGEKLLATNRAYADPYTAEELQKMRQQAKNQKKPFLFRNFRPKNPTKWDGTQPLRFKSDPKPYSWTDAVMGQLSSGPEVIDDFIIIKPDGYPTYNFAHIVDDHLMQISHVIRSQEFIASVPKYLNLYEALNIKPPILATLPFVMGSDGKKKLSKRDGAKDILDYAKGGFLPESLISFLSTLGWNDGTEQEIFSIQELIDKFSLNRVQKSGAQFDEQRLKWINGSLIRTLDIEELYKKTESFWPPCAKESNDKYKKQILSIIQERLKFFAELPELTTFFFVEPNVQITDLIDKKISESDITNFLSAVTQTLQASSFAREDLENELRGLVDKLETRPGILFRLIRIAITGSTVAPGLFETLNVLGKETSIRRLEKFRKS